MRRIMVFALCTLGVASALPGIAAAVGLDTSGTACHAPESHQPPKFLSAQVVPADSAAKWTATYAFGADGSASVQCPKQKGGVAFNLGYGYKVAGRFGHGAAEEVIEITISGWQKDLQPNMNGTWTLTTALACPTGDPWLTGAACSVTGQVNKLHGLMTIKGPFPVTSTVIPPQQRLQLLAKSYPLIILKPWQGQSFKIGEPVAVQLKKAPALASQPVYLEFSRPGVGTWAGSDAFARQTASSSLTVSGSEFKAPGTWMVGVRYAASASIVNDAQQTFTIGEFGGGGSGGLPVPGSPGQGGGSQAAQGPKGGQIQARVPKGHVAAPAAPVKPLPPPVALARGRDPVRLMASQPSGPAALALVLQNPAGNEEKPGQMVELRLGGQVVGRGRVGPLAAGRDQRLVLNYQLPRGTRGAVGLEVWVGGQRIGEAQVTAGAGGRLRLPGQ